MQDDIRDRYRTARRDYTTVPQRAHRPATPAGEPKPPPQRNKIRKKALLFRLLLLLIVIGLATGAWFQFHHTKAKAPKNTSPVPTSIQQAVSFPVYYPDSKKLPAGYTFSPSSFSAGSGVAEFFILNGAQKIVFTEQTQTSSQDLQAFATSRIPLHNSFTTQVGTALIGAIGNNTVVSLPAGSKTWLIITAPGDINQTQLKQILNSLKT